MKFKVNPMDEKDREKLLSRPLITTSGISDGPEWGNTNSVIAYRFNQILDDLSPRCSLDGIIYGVFIKSWGSLAAKGRTTRIGKCSLHQGLIASVTIEIGREIVLGEPRIALARFCELVAEGTRKLAAYLREDTGEDHSFVVQLVQKAVEIIMKEGPPPQPSAAKLGVELEEGKKFVADAVSSGKLSRAAGESLSEHLDQAATELRRLQNPR